MSLWFQIHPFFSGSQQKYAGQEYGEAVAAASFIDEK
jgi:hypothetical protein